MLVLNITIGYAQSCDGNIFPAISQPSTCTYTYTSGGWEDSLGNPTTTPTANSSSQSICILDDYTGDFLFNIKGTLYIAPNTTYMGAVSTFGNSTLLVEGTADFTNAPSFSGNDTVIGVNGTINVNGTMTPQGDATINNAGNLNINGDFNMGGQANCIGYPGSKTTVQGNSTINAPFDNCGVFELFGSLSSGGSSGLKNLCSTYIHTDMNLNADYTNDAFLIIDGDLNFGTSTLYNDSTILINSITLNNDDLIGNNIDSFLIVRTSAVLSSGGSITGHLYYDVDDRGGFDSVCGSCIEDIDIVENVVIPSISNAALESCGDDIIVDPIIVESKLDFDGVDDYLSTPEFISGINEVTLMAWVKSDSGNSTSMTIVGEDTGCKLWLHNGDTPTFTLTSVGNAEVSINCTAINLNEWHHITGSYTSTTGIVSLYIDGELHNTGYVGNTGAAIQNTISTNGNFEIGRTSKAVANREYFKGDIDEVRVFDTVLTESQIQRIVYQEIENNLGNIRGAVIPKDITDSNTNNKISWSRLLAYYPMTDVISYDRTTDYSIHNRITKLHNITTFQDQTAPLPYVTTSSCVGNWSDVNNWLHGNVWDITGAHSEAAIINIKGHLETNVTHKTVGLILDTGSVLEVNGDQELNNSWYLKLNGNIDLQGESQLVQGTQSTLDVTSSGTLERDQQGARDYYTYNYWSSPVGISNASSNNNSFSLPDILKDGTVAATPLNITFLSSSYNGTPGVAGTTPIGVSEQWIWKYANRPSDTYSQWQHIASFGSLLAGEGYTMKGVDNSPTSFNEEQNYVFNGKPNNGDITLTLSADNDYLIGNPYPSALDANEFILDNISDGAGRAASNIFDGTLYFWDHFAGNTHVLREYQGGYATYNLLGGIVAVSTDARIDDSGQIGSKLPKRYIPVSQGFFVTADIGGTITFKNSQRIFKTEAFDPSLFMKIDKNEKSNANRLRTEHKDERQKIRLMFDSPNGYHRQLLVGVDENASNNLEKGYDAPLIENHIEDMFWVFDQKHYVIQAVNNFDTDQILPLGIKTNIEGTATIRIDDLENIPSNLEIYVHDKELNIYHDLRADHYNIYLNMGEYLNRFELTFSNPQTLNTNEVPLSTEIQVYYSNDEERIVIQNPSLKFIESVEMFNILGQSLFKFDINEIKDYITYSAKQIKSGAYILKIHSEYAKVSKKILIE